jgi:hypothetical protein
LIAELDLENDIMSTVLNLDKNGLIVSLFKQVAVKRILLRALLESNATDKMDKADILCYQIAEIEETAWAEVRKEFPEQPIDVSFTFQVNPPSIVVSKI